MSDSWATASPKGIEIGEVPPEDLEWDPLGLALSASLGVPASALCPHHPSPQSQVPDRISVSLRGTQGHTILTYPLDPGPPQSRRCPLAPTPPSQWVLLSLSHSSALPSVPPENGPDKCVSFRWFPLLPLVCYVHLVPCVWSSV